MFDLSHMCKDPNADFIAPSFLAKPFVQLWSQSTGLAPLEPYFAGVYLSCDAASLAQVQLSHSPEATCRAATFEDLPQIALMSQAYSDLNVCSSPLEFSRILSTPLASLLYDL